MKMSRTYLICKLHFCEITDEVVLCCSLVPKIDNSIKKMSGLLQQVRGGGQGQAISKSEVSVAADNVLNPLMDLLDGGIIVIIIIIIIIITILLCRLAVHVRGKL